jgi:hypothetical protein
MSSKRPRGAWGEGMLDDSWEWAAALGAATGLALQVSLTPTRRRRVWRVVVRVLDVVDGRPQGVRLQHAVDWPDATYAGLSATIFQAVTHLALRLEEDELIREQRPA